MNDKIAFSGDKKVKKIKKALLCIGNQMRGDDGVAMFLGQLVQKNLPNWRVFFGENVPENEFSAIRKFKPDILIVADAVCGIKSVEFLDLSNDSNYLYQTHNIPSHILLSYLRKITPTVLFLGIGVDIKNMLNINQNLSQNAKISAKKALKKLQILDKNL